MIKNRYLIFILLFLLVLSCKKKEDKIPVTISGVTWTDDMGQLIGPVDNSDWRLDDNWIQEEKDLFSNWNYNLNCNLTDTVYPTGFPNPTTGQFMVLFFQKGITTKAEICIVNQRFEKIYFYETTENDHLGLNLNDLSIDNSDTIFRVYYRLIDNSNCIKCGHGDIGMK